MANIPQLQAFQNQIPFGVPNQMPGSVPKGAEGLGVGGNQAMFNLPRVDFSVSRTTSSDPIANMMADIGNPMGGMSFSASPAPPAQPVQPLKEKMMPGVAQAGIAPSGQNPFGTAALSAGNNYYNTEALAGGKFPPQGSYPGGPNQQWNQGLPPFGLRNRMLTTPQYPSIAGDVFF